MKMSRLHVPFRSPNFTAQEVETLIYHLELKPELIKPAARVTKDGVKTNTGFLSVSDKLEHWAEIAKEINIAGENDATGILRTASDVKRKWNDLKSRVKIKAEDIRKGKLSDSRTPLSHLEERVLQLIAKTGDYPQGLNSFLPPAYFHVSGRRKPDKPVDSDPVIENYCPDSVELKNEETIKIETAGTIVTMPNITGIPVITLATPLPGHTVQMETGCSTNEEINTSWNENNENSDGDQRDDDKSNAIQMLYESQRELKKELKDIKKIMLKITEQKRRRLEQENEKIQLKKMKLMLKCKKQGVDFEEFITDFL